VTALAWEGVAWVAGGYVAGTLPSTWIVATLRRGDAVRAEADRAAGETDAHLLITKHLGAGWTAVAAAIDVAKGFVLVTAARSLGHLSPSWLALAGLAVVAGHSFPPYLRHMAGRGMAGMAGVYLALLPLEMLVAGLVIVVGGLLRATGLASTVALAVVPVLAALQGQPGAYVWMSVAVLVLIVARRLEGVRSVVRSGVPPGRAVIRRAVFDASASPPSGDPPATGG
jgi:acyl phosphate:glycerol-3-phosphate acyltransferase